MRLAVALGFLAVAFVFVDAALARESSAERPGGVKTGLTKLLNRNKASSGAEKIALDGAQALCTRNLCEPPVSSDTFTWRDEIFGRITKLLRLITETLREFQLSRHWERLDFLRALRFLELGHHRATQLYDPLTLLLWYPSCMNCHNVLYYCSNAPFKSVAADV